MQTVTGRKGIWLPFLSAVLDAKEKKPKSEARRGNIKIFEIDDYRSKMEKYNGNDIDCKSLLELEVESDPGGFDTVNQYLCSFLRILRDQRSQNINNLTKDHIQSNRVSQLMQVDQV